MAIKVIQLVVSRLVRPELRVEIEAMAFKPAGAPKPVAARRAKPARARARRT